MTSLLFVFSNNLVRAPLISLLHFDFRGKIQPYLDSTSIKDNMNLCHHFLWLVLINLLDVTAITHLLHKQSQDVFERFDTQASVKFR